MIPRNHFTKRHFDLGLPFEERMIKRTEYGNSDGSGDDMLLMTRNGGDDDGCGIVGVAWAELFWLAVTPMI